MRTELNTEKVSKDLKTLTRDVEDLLGATAGEVSDKAKEARRRLTESLEKAKETCATLQEKAIAGAKATDKAVREHPYQAAVIAFGVGLLVGFLVTRRANG